MTNKSGLIGSFDEPWMHSKLRAETLILEQFVWPDLQICASVVVKLLM